ncbi:hypothetical protein V4F39_00660 [Aquincola sp. MAHUQ-54]|uniref:DUF2946 family protein n=1 Tax=Aquincola agrisoli TaxID=3119538 RepID=A0AAW9Q7P0_9BURK
MSRLAPRRATRSRWAGLAALAMLLAQTLALLHGVVHPHAGGMASQVKQVVGPAAHVAASLAHHDDGSALCHLVDHLGHADALVPAGGLVLPASGPATAPAVLADGAALEAAAPYEARGPPAVRAS